MSAKTKGASLIATLLVVGVVIVGFNLVKPPNTDKRGPDEKAVTFTAIWTPSPRNFDGVHAEITVGNRLMYDKVSPVAPLLRNYVAQRGDNVEIRLRLVGAGLSNLLGCSIAVGGLEAVNDHIPKQPTKEPTLKAGDSIRCWTTVH